MSRISRYQESIVRFIKTKSSYPEIIKSYPSLESLINISQHEPAIIFLTIMHSQYKKKKQKTPNGYYMSSGIDIMLINTMINDNRIHFENIYGKDVVKNFNIKVPIYVLECLSQNMETLENSLDNQVVLQIQKKVNLFIYKKINEILKNETLEGNEKVHKTDIIKYRFTDKKIIDKYRKMKIIDKDKLISYVDRKYGYICQCAFMLGLLLGGGDEKMLNNMEKLGSYLGLLIKLSNDFSNIERDIKESNGSCYNLIINYGIHECFKLFDDNKIKLLEGCLTLDIYNITIKEIIDNIEKKFDTYLKNTDLELVSRYSSFSSL